MKNIVEIRLENFRALLANYKQAELARRIDRTPGQVQQWAAKARGKPSKGARNIDDTTARWLETCLGLPENWMDNDHSTDRPAVPSLVVNDDAHGSGPDHIPSEARERSYWYPLLGRVPAGDPRDAIETVMEEGGREGYGFTKYCPRGFCLRVEGDSMDPELVQGDVVLVDPDMVPIPGDVVVARNGSGEANIKYLKKDGGEWYLVPANPKYQARLLGDTSVIGVVRGKYKYYR